MNGSGGGANRVNQGVITFMPALAVFHCRWCLPETDDVLEMLPESVKSSATIIRLNCTARMEGELAIKALGQGYDGMLVLGCEDGDCHYSIGNRQAFNRLGMLRKTLEYAGIYPQRLGTLWLSPYDPESNKKLIKNYLDRLMEVGPFK